MIVIKGRGVVKGRAQGRALVSRSSLQGWSGIDRDGIIIQRGHPFEGQSMKEAVLVVFGGTGSTGWGSHLLEAKLAGCGPAAMIFPQMDSRTAAGAVVAGVPVVTDLESDPFRFIESGDWVTVDGDQGLIEIRKATSSSPDS